MPEEEQSRRESLLLKAVNPTDGSTCTVQVSYVRLQAVSKRSMGQLKEAAFSVPYVLARPQAVFQGLCQDVDEDARGYGWRCYVGVPPHGYRADGTEVLPWPGQVFLVFVNQDQVAYNWRWERCDEDGSGMPQGYRGRFRERLL